MSAKLLKVLDDPEFARSLGFPEDIRANLLKEKTKVEQQFSVEEGIVGGQEIFFGASIGCWNLLSKLPRNSPALKDLRLPPPYLTQNFKYVLNICRSQC